VTQSSRWSRPTWSEVTRSCAPSSSRGPSPISCGNTTSVSTGRATPHGLTGDEVLFESRILAVADTIEAIASDRPYRAALGIDAALRVIRDGGGTIFDDACVEACEAVAPQILARSAPG